MAFQTGGRRVARFHRTEDGGGREKSSTMSEHPSGGTMTADENENESVAIESASSGKASATAAAVPLLSSSSVSEETPDSTSSSSQNEEPVRGRASEEESTALLEGSDDRSDGRMPSSSPNGSSGHGHGHGHGHSHSHDKKKPKTVKMTVQVGLTFVVFVVELVCGIVNRSITMLADSYHMLADVMALVIAMFALWLSKRHSKKNGFGLMRAEVLGALANGVFMMAICFTIVLESVGRLLRTHVIKQPLHVLVVGVIGLAINLIGITMFHGHAHGGHGHSHGGEKHEEEEHEVEEEKEGERTGRTTRSYSAISDVCHNHLALRLVELENDARMEEGTEKETKSKGKEAVNLNMQGVFLHIVGDAVGSVIVIGTAALAVFFPTSSVNPYLDPILSLVLVVIMATTATRLVKETSQILLRLEPHFVDQYELEREIMQIAGVSAVQKLHVWTFVGNRHIASAEIEFCSAFAYDSAVQSIRLIFHRHGVHSLTIQPSFNAECRNEADRAAASTGSFDPPPALPDDSFTHAPQINTTAQAIAVN